ncbi:hypothetical protein [uncultured Clostridium sp.]|uniref:hypothetical protein n=1 Tax=uncultured Clostridium sp. TaxID=59620 RepID=UPI0025DDEBFD|nr:hypothetical protein [uncultured Clostridium sp.]
MKILLKCVLATFILVLMRFFYVKVVDVPFFEGVFITSILGFNTYILVEGLVIKKLSKRRNKR